MHPSPVDPTALDNRESLRTARRRALPDRRDHVTQKVRVANHRVLYLTVHDDPQPAEVFLRVKGPDVTSETVALYDVIARLLSVSLQYGASLEKLADLLSGTKFAPCGPITGHARIKACTSLPDFIGRYLLLEYCGREDVAHVPSGSPPMTHILTRSIHEPDALLSLTLRRERGVTMSTAPNEQALRTFEAIDLLKFSGTAKSVFVGVCSTSAVDNDRLTFHMGPQLFRAVLSLDGVLQPNVWSFLPERLIASDILIIARTTRHLSTFRCAHCAAPCLWLCQAPCGHHRCDGCLAGCPRGLNIDCPVQLHADGLVFELTSWVTCDLPDRLPLAELVLKLRQADDRRVNERERESAMWL